MTVDRPSTRQRGVALNIPDGSRTALTFLFLVTILPAVASGTPADHHDEPFVYEHIDSSYRFETDGTWRNVVRVRVRAQNESGVQQLGQQLFPYVEGRNRLQVDFLRVHKLDGSVTDGSPDHLQDLPAPVTSSFPVYSDLRILHATVPSFRPGEVLEYQITNTLEKPEAPGRFWMSHTFQAAAIVLEETLEANMPAATTIRLHVGEGLDPEISEAKGRRTYTWKHSNTTRRDVSWQDMMVATIRPDIELSNFRDWHDVGSWYSKLQGQRASPNSAVRRQAKELVAGLDNDEAKIAAIYNYVSKEFRYLALNFGEGRYQPHSAAEVLANGYGDCKDKHTLLAAMLQAVGYRASPVLIGNVIELVPEVPSPESFDHMITAVQRGDDLLFVDSTLVASFGYLAAQLRGKQALLVPSDGPAHLVEIPKGLPFQSTRSFVVAGAVDTTGGLSAQVEHHFRGDDEFFIRSALLNMPREGWSVFATGFVLAFGFKGQVADFETSDLSDATEPLRLSYTLTQTDYLNPYSKEQKLDALMPPNIFPSVPEVTDGDVAVPLELGPHLEVTGQFELELPASFAARAPVAVAIDHDFASFEASYQVTDGKLMAQRKLVVKSEAVAPERFREFTAFCKTLENDREQSFTLHRSGDPVAAIAEMTDTTVLFKAAVDAYKGENYETAVALFSRVVDLEPEHKTAWFELGRALVLGGDAAKGVVALRRQIEIDPFHEHAHSNLGWALDKLEDAAGTEAAFRAQLEFYPLHHYANAHLGELLQRQDRHAEALPFLESALSIQSDDHYSRMLLGVCYMDLGRSTEGVDLLVPLAERTTDPWILYIAGYQAIEHGEHAAAIPLLKRLTELDPDHDDAFNMLGAALHWAGKLDEAIAAYQRQVEVNPRNNRAHDNLGRAFADQGNYAAAVEAFRQHHEIVPDDALSHYELGRAFWRLERWDEAFDSVEHSVRLEPANASLQSGFANLLFNRERFSLAQEWAEKALEVDPENASANRTLGLIMARQERYAEALPLLEKAKSGAPKKFADQDILDYVGQKVRGES